MDATEDVAIVADAQGSDQSALEDLSKTLGAALSVARATAAKGGKEKERLSELLDDATVYPRKGHFSLNMALPLEVLKEWGPCRKRENDGGR